MTDDNDKYPAETGRRRFVKGVVGASALGATGVTAAAATQTATSAPGKGGGTIQFMGIENIAGPAPRAMPQIPIEIDDDGFLKGVWPGTETIEENGKKVTVAETKMGGHTYSSQWFQYCGLQSYPGIQPGTDQDNFFRSASSAPYDWQGELDKGAKLNVSMFEDYETWGNDIGKAGLGKPALGNWRSQDLSPQNTLTIEVIRSTHIEEQAKNNAWLEASTDQGFIAWMDKCTHFCCVPGFKATAQSTRFGGANDVYCPCHQSVYDPFSIVQRQYVALPRPDDAGGGGSGGSSSGGSGSGGGSGGSG